MSGDNGKPKRKKHGRPKGGKGVSKKLIKTKAIEHDGSPSAMAEDLGISPATAHKHLEKPDIKKAVLSARAKAIKKAGLTRVKAYRQLADQLTAKKAGEIITKNGKVKDKMIPDYPARDSARKDFLKILGDYTDDTPTDPEGKVIPFIILLPQVSIEPAPPKGDTIDV